ARGTAPDRGAARVAGLRDGHEVLAFLQPAGCARRDLRDRAGRLYRAGARALARGGPGLLRIARAPRLSDGLPTGAGRVRRRQAGSGQMSATPTARTAASQPEKAQDDLLVELFTEELPPRALAQLAEAFAQGIAGQLAAHGLADDGNGRQVFCTPRRLAVLVARVAAQAPARAQRVKGPSVAVGLDAAGNPTVALRKWAERQGAALEALVRASDGKQECFFHQSVAEGDRLADVIEAAVRHAVSRLPVPRLMSYQLEAGCTTVSFARPAHRLTVLHGERVLPCRVLGLPADRITEGHRFQGTREIRLARASDYERELLEAGKVVASFSERRRRIAEALQTQADALGALLAPDAEEQAQVDALLDEVTALVEHPDRESGV